MTPTSAGPRGIICPLVTPLTEDEQLDRRVTREHVRGLLPHVDGLMPLGTTGELPILDLDVADELVALVTEEASGTDTQIVLGVGGAGWASTRDNLRRARVGVTHVAVCAPYYYPTAASDLLDYFRRVADVAPVPVVLYNIPQNTHQEIPVDTVARLSEHENIVGIKDSAPSSGHFVRLLELRSSTFTVLRGTDEPAVLRYRQAGADGFVSGLENIQPGLLRAAIESRSEAEAHAAVTRIRELTELVQAGGGLAAIKAAVALRHGGSGRTAAPLASLKPAQLRVLQTRLAALDLTPACSSEPAPKRPAHGPS